MDKERALIILKDHQLWRRAKPPYDEVGTTYNYSPKELGEAIDVAIHLMERREKYIQESQNHEPTTT